MKLSEIKRSSRVHKSTIEFTSHDWFEEVLAEPKVDVKVEYEYTPPDHTDHPYGSTTAREEHPDELDILSIKLVNDEEMINDDGEPSGEKLKAGTDMMKRKDWTDAMYTWAEKATYKELKKQND